VLPAATSGAILTFAFEGQVDVVDDRHGLLPFIHAGDPVTYLFSFDSNALDTDPALGVALYDGLSASLQVAGVVLDCGAPKILVSHPRDIFRPSSSVNIDLPGLQPEGMFYVALIDQAESNALADTALPLAPYDLAPFANRGFSASFQTPLLPPPDYSETLQFWGHIDRFYAVPEPTTLAMLALSLLTLRPRSR